MLRRVRENKENKRELKTTRNINMITNKRKDQEEKEREKKEMMMNSTSRQVI